jgi:hypothetical protein
MSAASQTRRENKTIVEELLTLPFSEQATRLKTYPRVRQQQIGPQLARELLIKDDYTSKSAEEAAAYRAALPPVHQFFVASVLQKGIPTRKKSASPSGSPTRKKSASPPTSRFGSSASKHRRTADAFTAVARSAPLMSPYERRLKAFRLQGLPFRYLAELTGTAEDTAAVSRYENINLVKNFYGRDFPTLTEEDNQLVADIFSLDRGIAGAARDAAITRIRAQFLRKKTALLDDIKDRFVAPLPLDQIVDHKKKCFAIFWGNNNDLDFLID